LLQSGLDGREAIIGYLDCISADLMALAAEPSHQVSLVRLRFWEKEFETVCSVPYAFSERGLPIIRPVAG